MEATNTDAAGEERPQINSDRARALDNLMTSSRAACHCFTEWLSENWVTLWTRKTRFRKRFSPLTNTWISSMAERKCRRG